jgi:hypothetical protein
MTNHVHLILKSSENPLVKHTEAIRERLIFEKIGKDSGFCHGLLLE